MNWSDVVSKLFSSSSIPSLVLLALIVFIAIKQGWLKVHTSHFELGSEKEDERAVLRHQIEWLGLYIFGKEKDLEELLGHIEGYSKERTLLILEKIYDEMIQWCLFNHIEANETYKTIKRDKVLSIIKSTSLSNETWSDKHMAIYGKWVDEIVDKLYTIRKYYDR